MTNDEAMVERVARAIHKALYNAGRQIAPGFPGEYLNDGNRFSDEGLAHERLMAQARAAIEAISASGAVEPEREATAITIEYDNDTGPDDGGFWEWWSVVEDGRTIAKCDREADAIRIAAAIRARGQS